MRRLVVTRTWEIRSGTSSKNKPWTLYGVEANDEQGNAIPHELKSFSKLPNGSVQVDVERQEHEQYGVSYLLKPQQRSGGGAGSQELAELRDRIERLESRVAALDGAGPAGAGSSQPVAGLPDDDIPF